MSASLAIEGQNLSVFPMIDHFILKNIIGHKHKCVSGCCSGHGVKTANWNCWKTIYIRTGRIGFFFLHVLKARSTAFYKIFYINSIIMNNTKNRTTCVCLFDLFIVIKIYELVCMMHPTGFSVFATALTYMFIDPNAPLSQSVHPEQHQIITLSISVKRRDDLTMLQRGLPANCLAWRESEE